jgi:photosystem II stability/assembly factor-like uncharacterized protein
MNLRAIVFAALIFFPGSVSGLAHPPQSRFFLETHGERPRHKTLIPGNRYLLTGRAAGQSKSGYVDFGALLQEEIGFETPERSGAFADRVTEVRGRRQPGLRWVRTGGPLGGLGYDVRMRPDNPDIVYVTDAWSGVNISVDGGRTWLPSNNGIITRAGHSGDAIPVFCLTIDPHNPEVLWIGTQNRRGIFKSTDGGKTWVEKDNGISEREGISFRGLTVDPRDSKVIYAAAEISSFAWAGREISGREFDLTKGVVYKTTDGGEHWTGIWRGDNLARYIWINPRDPEVMYVSTGIFDREAANSDARRNLPGGVGIVKSTDGGRTWQVLGRANGLTNLYIGTLFMHPRDPDVLLAGAGSNAYPEEAGVFLSTNGGRTWENTLRGVHIHSVEFAVSDPRIAYAAGIEAVYRSEDGGRTWRRVTQGGSWGPPGIQAGFPIDLEVDPRDANRLFANNYGGGNFLSEDGGRTWVAASRGYTGAQVRDIAVDARTGRVFAAARSGLYVSTNKGSEWQGVAYPPAAGIEWYVVAVEPFDSWNVLAASNAMGVIVQSYGERWHWREVSKHPGPRMSWRAIAFAPSNPAVVYAGTSAFFSAGTFDDRMGAAGIYISENGGGRWREANDANSRDANVAAIAVAPHDPRIVYAATCNRGLLRSTDGGQRWQTMRIGQRVRDVRALAIDPTDPQIVYAGVRDGGVWKSVDGGKRWQHSSSGMDPEASVTDIVLDPTDSRILYAADIRTGVYRSEDGGRFWVRIDEGLRTRAVNALAITSDGRTLYAATEGEGVFRLDIGE